MKEITKKWLDFARADLEAAEVLYESGKTHWSDQLCVYHCHQCVEKILKTVIIKKGNQPKRIHDLISLLEESDAKLPKHLQEYIKELNPHYQLPRYPDMPARGPVFKYDKKAAEYHIKKTKEILLWLKKSILK